MLVPGAGGRRQQRQPQQGEQPAAGGGPRPQAPHPVPAPGCSRRQPPGERRRTRHWLRPGLRAPRGKRKCRLKRKLGPAGPAITARRPRPCSPTVPAWLPKGGGGGMKGERGAQSYAAGTWAPEAPWLSGIHLLGHLFPGPRGPLLPCLTPLFLCPQEELPGAGPRDRKGQTHAESGSATSIAPRGQSRRSGLVGPLHQDPSACLLPLTGCSLSSPVRAQSCPTL